MKLAEMLADIAPGDRLDVDEIDPGIRAAFLQELDFQGMVIGTDGIVGQIETCPECDGEGQLKGGRECRKCEGFSLVADFGKGFKAYRE